MSQAAPFYVLSLELAAGLLSASGRSGWWMEIVTADQAVNILKAGGGPVAIAGEDLEHFRTLAALHGWRFQRLTWSTPRPGGKTANIEARRHRP